MPDTAAEKTAIANLMGWSPSHLQVMADSGFPHRLLINQAIVKGIVEMPGNEITSPDLLLLIQSMKHERSKPHPYTQGA